MKQRLAPALARNAASGPLLQLAAAVLTQPAAQVLALPQQAAPRGLALRPPPRRGPSRAQLRCAVLCPLWEMAAMGRMKRQKALMDVRSD